MYGGRRAVAHGLPLVVVLSAVMGGGQMAMSLVDTTVACFLPATMALVYFAFIIKAGFYRKLWNCPSSVMQVGANQAAFGEDAASCDPRNATPSVREAALCASPFAFLTLASILVFVVPGVRESVDFIQIGGIRIVGHAGFVLAASCLFAFGIMMRAGRLDAQNGTTACKEALGRLWGASAGIIVLVVMARVMQETGQMRILAEGVAAATGAAYIPFAPAMGTFGAFVTSSNMSSNILLAGFQHAMAGNLGVSPALLLAAQTAGGAAGAAIGGAATVGASGKEGEMLKPLLAVSFAQAALIGAIALLFAMS